jgi:AcrR family transcriptional regulator
MARPALFTPEEILDAAERVFARQGYGETSLRQLMAAAEVSTTAFYARFDSKEAVLAALVERLLGSLYRAEMEALGAVRSMEEGIERGSEVMAEVLGPHRRLVAIAMTEAVSCAPVKRTLQRAYAGLMKLLAAQLEAAARAQGTTLPDPDTLSWAFVGALQFQVVRWSVFEDVGKNELAAALRDVARTFMPAIGSGKGKAAARKSKGGRR